METGRSVQRAVVEEPRPEIEHVIILLHQTEELVVLENLRNLKLVILILVQV